MLPDEASTARSACLVEDIQLNAITSGAHSKCPMLILAGDAADGKSLLHAAGDHPAWR